MRADTEWKHHDGYPRDIGDDEVLKRKQGDLNTLVVVTELMSGHYDVAHHVAAQANGLFRGCSSSHPRCIGVIDRIDRKTQRVHIRLNLYGQKWIKK